MKRQVAAATAAFAPNPNSQPFGPICNCRSFRWPHFLIAHNVLRSDHDWRTWEEQERCQNKT